MPEVLIAASQTGLSHSYGNVVPGLGLGYIGVSLGDMFTPQIVKTA